MGTLRLQVPVNYWGTDAGAIHTLAQQTLGYQNIGKGVVSVRDGVLNLDLVELHVDGRGVITPPFTGNEKRVRASTIDSLRAVLEPEGITVKAEGFQPEIKNIDRYRDILQLLKGGHLEQAWQQWGNTVRTTKLSEVESLQHDILILFKEGQLEEAWDLWQNLLKETSRYSEKLFGGCDEDTSKDDLFKVLKGPDISKKFATLELPARMEQIADAVRKAYDPEWSQTLPPGQTEMHTPVEKNIINLFLQLDSRALPMTPEIQAAIENAKEVLRMAV